MARGECFNYFLFGSCSQNVRLHNSDSVTVRQAPLPPIVLEPAPTGPMYLCELLAETQPDVRPADVGDRSKLSAVRPSLVVPPEPVAFFRSELPRISQMIYAPRKLWDYTLPEPISFQVNDFIGGNVGQILHHRSTALEGRGDLVARDSRIVLLCRFLVRSTPLDLSNELMARVKFPDDAYKVGTDRLSRKSCVDCHKRFLQRTGVGIVIQYHAASLQTNFWLRGSSST